MNNIKFDVDQRRKAIYDERARENNLRKGLLSQEAHHWPLESLEYAYAWACLEIVLLHSDKASHIYTEIRDAWVLPGCKAMIDGFKDCLPVTNDWKLRHLRRGKRGRYSLIGLTNGLKHTLSTHQYMLKVRHTTPIGNICLTR